MSDCHGACCCMEVLCTYEATDDIEDIDCRQREGPPGKANLHRRPGNKVAHGRNEQHLQQCHRDREMEAVGREQRLQSSSL